MKVSSMAVNSTQFPTRCSSISTSISTPVISDLSFKLKNVNPLFLNLRNSPSLKHSSRRSLSVTNTVSDQKLQDAVTDDKSMPLYFSSFFFLFEFLTINLAIFLFVIWF